MGEEKPELDDVRIKVCRVDRFRWSARTEVYTKQFKKSNDWVDCRLYQVLYARSAPWRRGWFRWVVVLRAANDYLWYLRQLRRQRRRDRLQRTEYIYLEGSRDSS